MQKIAMIYGLINHIKNIHTMQLKLFVKNANALLKNMMLKIMKVIVGDIHIIGVIIAICANQYQKFGVKMTLCIMQNNHIKLIYIIQNQILKLVNLQKIYKVFKLLSYKVILSLKKSIKSKRFGKGKVKNF